MTRALAITAAALAAFTVLVVAGGMTWLDEWGISHVMPGLDPTTPAGEIVHTSGLWRPFPLDIPWWEKLLDVYTYPASALISAATLAAAGIVLERRGERLAAVVWIGAWCLANAAELAGKHELTRPGLEWWDGSRRIHVAPFDSSYPSGHATRAVVTAAIVSFVWPRLRPYAVAWVVFVPVALVVSGAHTIADVVGGVLLGLLLALAAHAIIGRWAPSTTSSEASSEASWPTRPPSSPTSRARASSSPNPS